MYAYILKVFWKTLPTKSTPGGRSATNFAFKGGGVPKNVSYILLWFPSSKVAWKR